MSSPSPPNPDDDERDKEFERNSEAATPAEGSAGGNFTKSTATLCAISDPQFANTLDIVFKLGNMVNQLWTFLVIISGAVAGWSFSLSGDWGRGQRSIATLLYLTFILVNGCALFRMYRWLDTAMEDLRAATGHLDEQAPKLKVAMSRIKIPGGQVLPYIVYVLVTASVVASIWYPLIKAWIDSYGGSVKPK